MPTTVKNGNVFCFDVYRDLREWPFPLCRSDRLDDSFNNRSLFPSRSILNSAILLMGSLPGQDSSSSKPLPTRYQFPRSRSQILESSLESTFLLTLARSADPRVSRPPSTCQLTHSYLSSPQFPRDSIFTISSHKFPLDSYLRSTTSLRLAGKAFVWWLIELPLVAHSLQAAYLVRFVFQNIHSRDLYLCLPYVTVYFYVLRVGNITRLYFWENTNFALRCLINNCGWIRRKTWGELPYSSFFSLVSLLETVVSSISLMKARAPAIAIPALWLKRHRWDRGEKQRKSDKEMKMSLK